MVKKVECYETEDGKIFFTEQGAMGHEELLELL